MVKIWMMRQAGRYMEKYMNIRKNYANFINMCYNEEAVCEITMQPIDSFDMDYAIIFSDILLILDALAVEIEFKTGIGPVIKQIEHDDLISKNFDQVRQKLLPLFSAISRVRKNLSDSKQLIGFAGAPWTMLSYYIHKQSPGNCLQARKFIYSNPKQFKELIDFITEMTFSHLKEQIKAGVNVIKLFDSNSGCLSKKEFFDFVIEPTRNLVSKLKEEFPQIKVMGFPKGAGILYEDYAILSGVDIMTIDYSVPLKWARDHLQKHVILQGNLNPFLLAYDIEESIRETRRILDILNHDERFIFNLGHGIIPETPENNVSKLIDFIRKEA